LSSAVNVKGMGIGPSGGRRWVRLHPLVRRLLSPAGFLLVACCFLLPFVTVSCTPAPKATLSLTYTGADLVAGSRAEVGVTDEFRRIYKPIAEAYGLPSSTGAVRDTQTKPIAPQHLMAMALALAISGIVLSGLTQPWPRALAVSGTALTAAIILGGAEVIAVHAARIRLDTDAGPLIGTTSNGVVTIPARLHLAIQAQYGFWLALSLLAVLAAGNAIAVKRLSRRQTPTPELTVTPAR
jgi:hypothetical protein